MFLHLISVKGTEFTVDHFSFLKEPIGLDDPSKEIIREASVRKSLAVSFSAPLNVKFVFPVDTNTCAIIDYTLL